MGNFQEQSTVYQFICYQSSRKKMDTKEQKNSNMIPQEKAIITVRRSVNLVMPLTIMGTTLLKHLFIVSGFFLIFDSEHLSWVNVYRFLRSYF